MAQHKPRRILDLSHPLDGDTPPFPGDPAVEISVLDSTDDFSAEEGHLNCSQINVCVHCGTHMDAPFHFFGRGQCIDQVPLDRCMGPAVLVQFRNGLQNGRIDTGHLRRWDEQIRTARRVVLNTGWYHRWRSSAYFTDHPELTREAAQYLVDCGAVLIGVDFPSVDRAPHDAHVVLLGNGVPIIENLTNLDAVKCETFEISAVPLRITGRDGSPVRAVAIV